MDIKKLRVCRMVLFMLMTTAALVSLVALSHYTTLAKTDILAVVGVQVILLVMLSPWFTEDKGND